MALNTTDVVTAFGAHYKNNGQNQNSLYQALYENTDTTADMELRLTDSTEEEIGSSALDRVLQPYQEAFTPLGTLSLKGRTIKLYQQKIDFSAVPHQLESTWYGFLASADVDPSKWPFWRWFMEKHLIPKGREDNELNEVFKGIYVAPTANTPGAAGTSMNGLRKCINDDVTAGYSNVVTIGAPDSDPVVWVDQVEDFVRQVRVASPQYNNWKQKIRMSHVLHERYRLGVRKKYGKDSDWKAFPGTEDKVTGSATRIVDNDFVSVCSRSSMAGSNMIFMTPDWNLIVAKKKSKNMENFDVQKSGRQVWLLTDWFLGVKTALPTVVWRNDQTV